MNDDLKRKVQLEYEQGYNHIRGERERKRKILEKLIPHNIPEGQIRVNLLWKNLQLERALFVQDKLTIKAICNDTILGKTIMENAQKVFEYDDEDMDMIYQREDIVDNNALYGVAITVVDNYDDEEQQPIQDTISPLAVIPDPKNWRGSKMRFFGFERRLTEEYLRSAPGFKNVDKVIDIDTSYELKLNDESYNTANKTVNIQAQDGLIDVYDHFTVFKGKKVLTTWANNRELCIRYIELGPLTRSEQLQPSKIKYPIQIHRRKNKPNSFFGVSIADEIMQYQDLVSQLVNLQIIQARLAGLGPDRFVDVGLGIDLTVLNQKLPGGRTIQVKNTTGNIANSLFIDQQPNPSQLPLQMTNILENYSKETTGAGDIAYGQSQSGSQTKAEIQTLMQNSNQLLSSVADSYIRGQKEYWEAHYRSYALNMRKKDKKIISLYQKGEAISLTMNKYDFIADGKVQIVIESKNLVDKENEQNAMKLMALQGVYLPVIQGTHARNEFLRKLGNAQGIKNFDSEKYIELSVDEIRARANLELLNRNEDVGSPQPGEDFRTYLSIYREAMDTEAKFKVVFQYTEALKIQAQMVGSQPQIPQQGDNQTKSMAMNSLSNQQRSATPSLKDVSLN